MSDRSPIPGWAVWEAGIDITDVPRPSAASTP
jgi:hypothetical protein